MKIKAVCGKATRVYGDSDVVMAIQSMTRDTSKTSRAYERIKKGETVKVNYFDPVQCFQSDVYFRKVEE